MGGIELAITMVYEFKANGKVIYGYRFDHQLLQVVDGMEPVCQSNSSHVVVPGGLYCPQCGSTVKKRDRMVPSPIVVEYATQYGMSIDVALSTLLNCQHQVPQQWFDPNDSEDWLFGVTVVDGGANTCTEFYPFWHPDRIEGLEKAVLLFTDLGLDPAGAKYYLLVKPS